jgi:PKD repeat protein
VASFTASSTSGTAPFTVTFTDSSTGSPTNWYWNFGDGTGTSTSNNPSYTYNNPGTYTVTLTVTNSEGSSSTSTTITVLSTLSTVPGAPTGVTATAGNAQATVSFSPPTSNGGSVITGYTVTSSAGQTGTGTSSPIVVSGLTNGTSYTFTVTATNAAGTGPASAPSDSVTPSSISYSLSVSVTGNGKVDTTPGTDMACSNSCNQMYTSGTAVTLAAVPATGCSFAGWSGGCSGTGSCVVTMSADMNVTAAFQTDAGAVAVPALGLWGFLAVVIGLGGYLVHMRRD